MIHEPIFYPGIIFGPRIEPIWVGSLKKITKDVYKDENFVRPDNGDWEELISEYEKYFVDRSVSQIKHILLKHRKCLLEMDKKNADGEKFFYSMLGLLRVSLRMEVTFLQNDS